MSREKLTVNGFLAGWLGRCFCKPGEVVELVVAQAGEEYLVYALAKPEECSISMTPCSYRGKRQARWKGTWFWLGMLAFCVLVLFFIVFINNGVKGFLNPELYHAILWGGGGAGCTIVGPALYSVWRRHPFPQEDLAEGIFTVMGWKNVTDINLGKLNRHRKRQWKRTGIPANPFRDQTPFSYTGWGRWFYYY